MSRFERSLLYILVVIVAMQIGVDLASVDHIARGSAAFSYLVSR